MSKPFPIDKIPQLQRDLFKAKAKAKTADTKYQLKLVRAQLVAANYEITRLRASQLTWGVA